MKTMTCKQLGGPCDFKLQGETSLDVMNKGAAHVMEMSMQDDGHKKAMEMMVAAQKDPALAKQWGDKFEADFAVLPND